MLGSDDPDASCPARIESSFEGRPGEEARSPPGSAPALRAAKLEMDSSRSSRWVGRGITGRNQGFGPGPKAFHLSRHAGGTLGIRARSNDGHGHLHGSHRGGLLRASCAEGAGRRSQSRGPRQAPGERLRIRRGWGTTVECHSPGRGRQQAAAEATAGAAAPCPRANQTTVPGKRAHTA